MAYMCTDVSGERVLVAKQLCHLQNVLFGREYVCFSIRLFTLTLFTFPIALKYLVTNHG